MNMIANQEKIGVSKLDLYFFQVLYVLSFKKLKWAHKQMVQVTKDLETVKNKKIY